MDNRKMLIGGIAVAVILIGALGYAFMGGSSDSATPVAQTRPAVAEDDSGATRPESPSRRGSGSADDTAPKRLSGDVASTDEDKTAEPEKKRDERRRRRPRRVTKDDEEPPPEEEEGEKPKLKTSRGVPIGGG